MISVYVFVLHVYGAVHAAVDAYVYACLRAYVIAAKCMRTQHIYTSSSYLMFVLMVC